MIAKPSAETTSVGTQKNNTRKMVLPRLAAKKHPNDNAATTQNLGERILSTNRPATKDIPVAFVPLRKGQKKNKFSDEYRR